MFARFILSILVIQLFIANSINAQVINTIAGGVGDYGAATAAGLTGLNGVAVDKFGNLFICGSGVRKVTPSGVITTYTDLPTNGIAVDTFGNAYVSVGDPSDNEILKIDTFGVVAVFAGASWSNGDGIPAISAWIHHPLGLVIDRVGNLYVAEYNANKIRKVDTAGIITTVAGTGVWGANNGDGGPATAAGLVTPSSLATDRRGNIYALCGKVVRKINVAGSISTYAGNTSAGFTADGHRADSSVLRGPTAITSDRFGNIYIYDSARIRKVDTNQIITTIAGTGVQGYFGEGLAATVAQIYIGNCICTDDSANVYFGDKGRIRRINTHGIVNTVAGNGVIGNSGDGGAAISAQIGPSNAITIDKNNTLYIYSNYPDLNVRKVDNSGIISVFAGNGRRGCTGDGGLAVDASIEPNGAQSGLVTDTAGNLLLTNSTNNCIRKVFAATLSVSTGTPVACSGSSITFTATGNGLSHYSPVYHWRVNGKGAGTNNAVFTTSGLVNGDRVNCEVSDGLEGMTVAISNSIVMGISPAVYPSVAFSTSPGYAMCAGTTVTCVATSTSGGTAPVFDWYKNGTIAFSGTPYVFIPVNGDSIYCKITSNALCRLVDTAVSAVKVFSVNPGLPPSVTVSITPGSSVCPGTGVACTANPLNGGSSPQYQWFKNGIMVRNGSTYNFTPANGDAVYCKLTSNASWRTSDTAVSATSIIAVTDPVTPSVTVTASPGDSVCSGTSVTCTAVSVNCGTSPTIRWYKDNNQVGMGDTYTFVPEDRDYVGCQVTPGGGCFTTGLALSNNLYFTITHYIPNVTISLDPGTAVCEGTPVACTATGIFGGTAPDFRWFLNNTEVAEGASFSFPPHTGDRLYCEMTSNNPCASPASVTSDISLFKAFITPSVTITSDIGPVIFGGSKVTFKAGIIGNGSDYTYRWMKNGVLVPGYNSATYTTDNFNNWDSVLCIITGDSICPDAATSNSLSINTYHPLKVYPNPNNGNFVVNGNDYEAHDNYTTIAIINSEGCRVYERNSRFNGISFYESFLLNRKLPPGVYTVYISYGAKKATLPFLVKY